MAAAGKQNGRKKKNQQKKQEPKEKREPSGEQKHIEKAFAIPSVVPLHKRTTQVKMKEILYNF